MKLKALTDFELLRATPGLCPAAWTQVALTTTQRFRMCCMAKPFDKKFESFTEYWNSPELEEVRKNMLSGQWSSHCVACERVEKSGAISKRYSESNHLKMNWTNHSIENLSLEGSAALNPLVLETRLSNRCNLRCRMCSPSSSTRIGKEYSQLAPIHPKLFSKSPPGLTQIKLTDLEHRLPPLKSIRILRLVGGEPLLDPENKNLCERFIEMGYAQKVSLIITTNMTLLNDEWLQRLSHFEKVFFHFSLDATGSLLEYIRDGSNWNELNAQIRNTLEKLPLAQFQFVPCIQAYNVLDLKSVYEYAAQLNQEYPNNHVFVYPNFMYEPHHLVVGVLSKNLRNLACERLSPLLKSDALKDYEKSFLRGIIAQVKNAKDASESTVTTWKKFTLALDQSRNQSLRAVSPLLADHLDSVDESNPKPLPKLSSARIP